MQDPLFKFHCNSIGKDKQIEDLTCPCFIEFIKRVEEKR